MKTYRLSSTGRRTALILLVGAVAIWGFALWMFRSTLDISYNPLLFWGTVRSSVNNGLGVSQIVPALLMLVLIVATPLLVWNILEEWAASYTPTAEGLRFEALGVGVVYPWDAISAVRRVDDDSDEPVDELVLARDFTGQIKNPVLRFLHAQAYGRKKLPLYAGVESRDELISEIKTRAGIVDSVERVAA